MLQVRIQFVDPKECISHETLLPLFTFFIYSGVVSLTPQVVRLHSRSGVHLSDIYVAESKEKESMKLKCMAFTGEPLYCTCVKNISLTHAYLHTICYHLYI
jgi:hypothetical protein